VADLDTLQTDTGGDLESFVADAKSIHRLSGLVNYAVTALFEVALSGRQERSLFIEEDSTAILLAQRFYGLEADDSTINEFMDTNDLTEDEYVIINKGRKVIYYI
jgi:hypothetical protein